MMKKLFVGLILSLLLMSSFNVLAINVDLNEKTVSTEENPEYFELIVEDIGPGSVDPSYGMYEAGTEVVITAYPDEGFIFWRWLQDLDGESNPATIVMDSDKMVYAYFVFFVWVLIYKKI